MGADMNLRPFKLEQYFARYEFHVPYNLCPSDCEALTLHELLSYADDETRELWEKLSLGYTETQGHPLLRREIASLYANVSPEEVLLLTPEEGIFIAMNAILERGDHVIATFPSFQSLYDIAASQDCEVTYWMPEEHNHWRFNIEAVEKAIKNNTKLIVMNFPHNPTGALASREDFERILEVANKHNLVVFSDEMYRLLEYNPADRLDSATDLYDNAVSLSGLSKAFGLPGLRIGWLTTRIPGLFDKLLILKSYTTICSSAPSEILALIALRAKERIIERNLAIIRKNLGLLDDFFDHYSDVFSWVKPRAGSIAFPKLLLAQDISTFCAQLVEKQGVLLLPSTIYDYAGNHFRIGFGRKNMPDALAQLEAYLAERRFH